MEWIDEGIVLGRRAHGEHAAIVTLFTRHQGRHPGLARGGGAGRGAALYEAGNVVRANWRARLPEHLGNYKCELTRTVAALLLDDADRLAALSSMVALLELVLPEREPHAGLYEATIGLLDALDRPDWAADYVRWECRCLADLGFGLDLASCAATGELEDLRYVSPRTGRAVSGEAGAPYADKLFQLPGFLRENKALAHGDLVRGLDIAGHFLTRYALAPHGQGLPAARVRLYERWRKADLREKRDVTT